MEFLKELLYIQHKLTLEKTSDILLSDEYEKQCYLDKYSKTNFTLIKVCNCKQHKVRVKINDLLYNLKCDHNPS